MVEIQPLYPANEPSSGSRRQQWGETIPSPLVRPKCKGSANGTIRNSMIAGIQRLEKYIPTPVVSSTKEILTGIAGSPLLQYIPRPNTTTRERKCCNIAYPFSSTYLASFFIFPYLVHCDYSSTFCPYSNGHCALCIYRASSIDLRRAGNALFIHQFKS